MRPQPDGRSRFRPAAAAVVLPLAATLGLCAGPAAARVWQVPGEVPTIQAGADSAAAGDILLVSAGTYHENVLIARNLIIVGATGDPADVRIDGGGRGACLTLWVDPGVSLGLESVTLRNAFRGIDQMWDIENGGADIESRHCIIEQCGTGVRLSWGTLLIENCTVQDNTEGLSLSYAEGTIRDSVARRNGTALLVGEAHALAERSLFEGNGLAIRLAGPQVGSRVHQCTIVGNDLAFLLESETCLGVYHSVVSGNQEVQQGTYQAVLFPIGWECGGANYFYAACTDIWGNAGGDWVGPLAVLAGALGNLSTDPLYCNPAVGDYRLLNGSPLLAENSGGCGLIGAFGGCGLTGVAPPSAPARFGIETVRPNPFNPRTTVVFALEAPGEVELAVYDLAGRRVRALIAGERRQAGTHEAVWDGRDDAGRVQPAGLYLCRLRAGQRADTRTLMLIK